MQNDDVIPQLYCQIRVGGRLDERWSGQLDGMQISTEPFQGRTTTLLTGPLADQAALYGLLGRIRDLGLALISVNPVSPSLKARADPGKRPADEDALPV
jgi:hypothetical protein